MTDTTPPVEAQRYGRSQTPESPRPVHLAEPAKIPVLMHQMDPVFNDTATYNIPADQNFSPYSNRNANDMSNEEHDAVQDFLRGAEAESALAQNPLSFVVTQAQHDVEQADSPNAQSVQQEPFFPSPISHVVADLVPSQAPTIPRNGPADLLSSSAPHPAASATHGGVDELSKLSQVPETDPPTVGQSQDIKDAGVDYSSLLASLAKSVSMAPAGSSVTAPTATVGGTDEAALTLTSVPGLPPKPPAQPLSPPSIPDAQPDNVQLAPHGPLEEIRPEPSALTQQGQANEGVLIQQQTQDAASSATVPVPSYAQISQQLSSVPVPLDTLLSSQNAVHGPEINSAVERPWSPKTQVIYDQFLEDERKYVTEGIWDKFPHGSRLFVGNLPSEKVTKRDLFHIFHRHGRLAQISIKQAYGFVQYLEASSCALAMQAEQGVEIRGRKVHLEISKPQKNARGAGASNNKQQNARRRSRSPDRRGHGDRFGSRSTFSDARDDTSRRREEPRRSNSPGRYRSREDYPPPIHSPRDYLQANGRTRSPSFSAYSPPSYPQQPYDEDAALPLPRRSPTDVPDVQILILDNNVPQAFINWVEDCFRNKGLRVATIWLSARLPLQAVVKRQILEGVQGVVKLIHHNQFTGKIPLQVFDRCAGASNVNFNEYVDLDVQVAADIVIHARQKERGQIHQSPQAPQPPSPFGPPQAYARAPVAQHPAQQFHVPIPPPYQQQRPPQAPNFQYGYPPPPPQLYQQPLQPSQASPTATKSSNLQQLLENLRQTGEGAAQGQHATAPSARQPDIGGLLSNIVAHQRQQAQGQVQPSSPTASQPNSVQNIMEQLARYQR
ncbi:hypothetical protein DV736_g2525, partial [Chaetothyriales sp. CBS 134916]